MMRWIAGLSLTFLIAWGVYAASPYLALYDLSRAVEARDVAAITNRVNVRAVRISLAKQLVEGYLVATGREGELKSATGQLASGLGATIADPIVAELVTPQRLVDLLNDGWPETVTAERPTTTGGIGVPSLGAAWRFLAASEARGFRRVFFSVPPEKPADQRFRLEMRLGGFQWRLTSVELPVGLRQQLVQRLMREGETAMK